jgi:CBS domain-containing protein
MPAKKETVNWVSLTALDIMKTTVLTVSTNTPLAEVERLLSERRISGVPVTDEVGHIVGVISMRDLIEHYSEDPSTRPGGSNAFYNVPSEELPEGEIESLEMPEESQETVGEIMTAAVYTVGADADLREISRKMVDMNIHRILVEDNGKTVGLISTMDILKALAQ